MCNPLKQVFLTAIFIYTTISATGQISEMEPNFPADTLNIYRELLYDESDDLMENHPADDIYNNIWTSEKLNPYKIPVDSLPDSILIDCRDFVMPVRGMVTSDYGPRRYRYHYGTDLRLNIGDTVVSAFNGRVRIIDYEAGGYGHYVVIRHNNNLETVYAHLSEVKVVLNQDIYAGEMIALGGNTGHSTGPHLHFEIRYLGNAINPGSMINMITGLVHNPTYLLTKKKSFYFQHVVKQVKVKRFYKVRKGDTLGHIAIRHGTSVKALCKLNGFKQSKKLKPGQSIRIK